MPNVPSTDPYILELLAAAPVLTVEALAEIVALIGPPPTRPVLPAGVSARRSRAGSAP